MKKKNLFKLTMVGFAIIYITLHLLIDDYEHSKFFYPSLIAMWIMAFLFNLLLVKSDKDEDNNSKKIMSKKKKIIIISITIVLIVAIIWILGIVEL